eukprot:TRINITY_DN8042_c0_g1_i1.p1 TRINITY_DN8042_c0_g1~~TRINITY_DN8042_c0_g1_i1.p1  ORF type:complete len:273 (+),score=7.98 TRINITY_DN8042_c0_g1_i1:112-930(+)
MALVLCAGGLQQQRRFLSASTTLHRRNARSQTPDHRVHMYRQNELNPSTKRFNPRPSPLDGVKGLTFEHEEDRWDNWGNPRQMSTFQGKWGDAQFRPTLNWLSYMKFSRARRMGVSGWAQARLFPPRWAGTTRFALPPQLMLPPGYRPMTEFPTYKAGEYHPWFHFPDVRRKSPIENTPDIAIRHADDRAKKLDLLRYTLAASNFRIHTRARYESQLGYVWAGGSKDHVTPGGLHTAGPSTLWQFHTSKRSGEMFSNSAGPGTLPRTNDRSS